MTRLDSPLRSRARMSMSFTARVLVTIALVGLALLLWELRQVVLLLFGGIVFGTMLGALATVVARHAGLSYRWAVAVSLLLVVVVAGVIAIGAAALVEGPGDLDALRGRGHGRRAGPAGGMLFATPLMVVLMALVQRLYVDELLEPGSAGSVDRPAGR